MKLLSRVSAEWPLIASAATGAFFAVGGAPLIRMAMSPPWIALVFVWLFGLILVASTRVVRHAEHVSQRLGEPYGTLILTMSVTAIEIAAISAVMLHGDNNPTLVRDTLFAVIMIILNGMVGISILVGGWIHKEQHYNLQGANAYLSVIIPLAVLSLILPNFTRTTPGPTLSLDQQAFLVVVAIGLYVAFLAIQTGRHHHYFGEGKPVDPAIGMVTLAKHSFPVLSAFLLLAYLVPIIYMAELLAHPIDYLIETLNMPTAVGAVIIAILVATPEAMGAIRAAVGNQMQRSMNIFLGSVLSTIGFGLDPFWWAPQCLSRRSQSCRADAKYIRLSFSDKWWIWFDRVASLGSCPGSLGRRRGRFASGVSKPIAMPSVAMAD